MAKATGALIAAIGLLVAGGGAFAQSAPALTISDFVGVIELESVPGAALDVRVEPGVRLQGVAPPSVSRTGDRVTVSGGWPRGRSLSCAGPPGRSRLRVDGRDHALAALPRLVVTAPPTLSLMVERSILQGGVGAIGEGKLALINCSALRVGPVGGPLSVLLAGGASLSSGAVAGPLALTLAGGAKADVASAPEVNATLAGGAQARIRSGRSQLSLNAAGGADFRHGGTVLSPQINAVGGADISLAATEGSPRVATFGGATVNLGRRKS
jgi:hypothetical protein